MASSTWPTPSWCRSRRRERLRLSTVGTLVLAAPPTARGRCFVWNCEPYRDFLTHGPVGRGATGKPPAGGPRRRLSTVPMGDLVAAEPFRARPPDRRILGT